MFTLEELEDAPPQVGGVASPSGPGEVVLLLEPPVGSAARVRIYHEGAEACIKVSWVPASKAGVPDASTVPVRPQVMAMDLDVPAYFRRASQRHNQGTS